MRPWHANSSLQGGRLCCHTLTHFACFSETAGEKIQAEKNGVWEKHNERKHNGRIGAV